MHDLPTSLEPLSGGWSGETFVAEAAGERSVVRLYAGRSVARGPLAPETDAALLQLVAPVIPVPAVLEARRGAPAQDVPGLLVCAWVDGDRLDDLLPDLGPEAQARVGAGLGAVLGRLGLVLQPRAGLFTDPSLVVTKALPDLAGWAEGHLDGLPVDCRDGLEELLAQAEDLLAPDRRRVLVHGDLNPKNLLLDPRSLEVTAVLDWEFAHAGGPWEDLGNLLRHLRPGVHTALLRAVLTAYAALVPQVPDDVLARAEAADLAALVELASRVEETPPVRLARERLRAQLGAPRLGWTWREAGA